MGRPRILQDISCQSCKTIFRPRFKKTKFCCHQCSVEFNSKLLVFKSQNFKDKLSKIKKEFYKIHKGTYFGIKGKEHFNYGRNLNEKHRGWKGDNIPYLQLHKYLR